MSQPYRKSVVSVVISQRSYSSPIRAPFNALNESKSKHQITHQESAQKTLIDESLQLETRLMTCQEHTTNPSITSVFPHSNSDSDFSQVEKENLMSALPPECFTVDSITIDEFNQGMNLDRSPSSEEILTTETTDDRATLSCRTHYHDSDNGALPEFSIQPDNDLVTFGENQSIEKRVIAVAESVGLTPATSVTFDSCTIPDSIVDVDTSVIPTPSITFNPLVIPTPSITFNPSVIPTPSITSTPCASDEKSIRNDLSATKTKRPQIAKVTPAKKVKALNSRFKTPLLISKTEFKTPARKSAQSKQNSSLNGTPESNVISSSYLTTPSTVTALALTPVSPCVNTHTTTCKLESALTANKTPINQRKSTRLPFKSPLISSGKQIVTVTPPISQKKQDKILREQVRKMEFVKKLVENERNDNLRALISEWQRVSREALIFTRDRVGPTQVTRSSTADAATDCAPSQRHFGNGWDQVYAQSDKFSFENTVRLLTLEEMASRLAVDINLLGEYDPDNDCFK